jgi:hypothetical protein
MMLAPVRHLDERFAVRFANDRWTLARIAGHSSAVISARYVHPSEDRVLEAISQLGGHKIGHSDLAVASVADGKLLPSNVN